MFPTCSPFRGSAGRLGSTVDDRTWGSRPNKSERVRPDRHDVRMAAVGSAGARLRPVKPADLTPGLRRDLLRYLAGTSKERARVIGELAQRNPAMAEALIDLEAHYDLRTRFEIELLHADGSGS
jgi:hypothetical protein